jgi:polyisoprenyl-phosphate glycosyltransferase
MAPNPVEPVDFSVVVPVYGGGATLEALYDRLAGTFTEMGQSFEVIFVNDGSPDGSLDVLRRLHGQHANIKVVDLYRNDGQQNALMCGFQFCSGRYVVTLDDDLQNPPEEIPVLLAKLEEGFDVAIGAYGQKQHGALRNAGTALMRKLNHIIFKPSAGLRLSSFRLVRREVIEQIKSIPTPFPYISGMLLSVTRRVTNVPVRHDARAHGRSGYTFGRLVRLSYNLLINYSSFPLKVVGYVGLAVSVLAFLGGAVFILRKLVLGRVPAGWTSLIVLLSFFFGLLYIMLFVLGEYVSRVLREVSHERQYAIREVML